MIDKNVLKGVIASYKKGFAKWWPDEKFKWEAVKCFQDNWDVEAIDFAEMLRRSLTKTDNLLLSRNTFPAGMITQFSDAAPERLRALFRMLFDESIDIVERIQRFKHESENLRQEFTPNAKNHYQNENTISVYLWLRFSDKYYIYKFREAKNVSGFLNSDHILKQGNYSANIRNYLALYDEICAELKKDTELERLVNAHLTSECYPDPELKTLTSDLVFYISRIFVEGNKTDDYWFGSDYSPGISVDTWIELLNDKTVFKNESLEVLKRIKDYGGAATCAQLAEKYGENVNFYNNHSFLTAKRIAAKTRCPVDKRTGGEPRWWTILYLGKNAEKTDKGVFIWKLRDELAAALEKVDLSHIKLYVDGKSEETVAPTQAAWLLAWNPSKWSWDDYDEVVSKAKDGQCYFESWRCMNSHVKKLDRVFLVKLGDSSTPKGIIASGFALSEPYKDAESAYKYVDVMFTDFRDYKTEHIITTEELNTMFPEQTWSPQGSGIVIKPEIVPRLLELWRSRYNGNLEKQHWPEKQSDVEKYTKSDFLAHVYMTESQYNSLVGLLKHKQNIILQGAPGVGKTFAAKRLAYSVMGVMDDSRIRFVQFHQNYSYEDFMMGYKPEGDGFTLKTGVFYDFCKQAANQPDKEFFFIIDEINRGNLSKIFGELLMLIEKDYRGQPTALAYNSELFSVPKNLYIIGMMNTADRSLAMIDYALRRRFSFFDMEPRFDSDGFKEYQAGLSNEKLDRLIDQVKRLNEEITHDKSLGKGFCIGHSYFCQQTKCTDEWLRAIVEYDILPTLREYWFDDEQKVGEWEGKLRGAING